MARKKRTPEENARREKIRELLQMANIGSMEDIQSLFKETIAEFMENGLEAELDDELGYSKYDYKNKDTDNSRNGYSSKTLRTSFGDVEVSVPRDRKGEFEPKVLKKNQTSISQDIEEKILSMYAKGMTTGDIEAHIQDIYGVEVPDTTVSRITDKILPIAKEWQQRPLESVYAVVFLDAIDGGIVSHRPLHVLESSQKEFVESGIRHVVVFDLPSGTFVVDIVGRVGHDEVCLGIAHQQRISLCFGAVSTNQAVSAQHPHITRFGECGVFQLGINIEVIIFDPILDAVTEESIDLRRLKASQGYIEIRTLQIGDQQG